MSWTLVTEKLTAGTQLTEASNYLFNSSAKINITKDYNYAIWDVRSDAAHTLVLNNDITLKRKNSDSSMYAGVIYNTSQTPTIRSAERNTKLTVDINTDVDDLKVYGIYRLGTGTMFLIGKGNENYRQTIAVSASNKAAAQAYGVYASTGKIAYNGRIVAPVTVKTTSKTGTADAYGIYAAADAGTVNLNNGITADISVTASGAGANAYGIRSGTGGITVSNQLAGKVTATATATGTNATDNAVAAAFQATGSFKVTKQTTKAITAKATSKSGKADAYGINAACSGTNDLVKLTFGLYADISATASGKIANAYAICSGRDITIADYMAGKITATATAKGTDDTDAAQAMGLCADNSVSIETKITKAITAKATSKGGEAYAYGIGIMANGTTITLSQGMSADISATASGPVAEAGALYAYTNLQVSGDVAGKVTATATGTDKANADAFASDKGNVTFSGKITKAVTAKATSKEGVANAYGMKAVAGSVVLQKGLNADISATASGSSGEVYAVKANSITVSGDMAGKITATASAADASDKANAYGLYADTSTLTVTGKITKAITAKATNKQGAANAYGIYAGKSTVALNSGISADISATATGNGSATSTMIYAYCINGNTGITVTGDAAGKLNATATGQNSASAYAYGLYSGSGAVSVSGQITKAITAKATGKQGNATADAIHANTTITLGGIAADISATASGAYASANAVLGEQGVTVNSDIAGKITAKATSTGSGKKAAAYGISSIGENGFITVGGDITKAITVSATSKTGPAEAYGVKTVGALTLVKNIGTVNVTASGAGTSDVATGWDVKNIVVTSGELTGKATVTCKTGTATGLIVGTIAGPVNAAYCTLNITATGKDAIGIKFTVASTPTLQDSKITVKGTNSAYCLYGSDERENLTISNSTLTGDVYMGGYNDNISLTNKSKLIGDVDMGADGPTGDPNDSIYIQSGSQIKGDIKNTEILGLYLNDASFAKSNMWEGDTAEATTSSGGEMIVRLNLNLSIGEDTTQFNLIKHTGKSEANWDNFTYELSLDGAAGSSLITLEYGVKYTGADSLYDYELKSDKSGNTLILAITEKQS